MDKATVPQTDSELLDRLISELFSFTDPSNWDSDRKQGVEFQAWSEVMEMLHEIADDYATVRNYLRRVQHG